MEAEPYRREVVRSSELVLSLKFYSSTLTFFGHPSDALPTSASPFTCDEATLVDSDVIAGR